MGEKAQVAKFDTLVRYNKPILVTKHVRNSAQLGKLKQTETVNLLDAVDSKKSTEEILNSILPPRCWDENGQLWQQTISTVPATRQDVINLQEQLDMRLQQTQARETGICPVRRELYSQCFDEVIREVTINCSERGLVLLRIRDEVAMTIDAYETLYCSSVAFGLRKAMQAHEEKEILRERVSVFEKERKILEEVIVDLKAQLEQATSRAAELHASEEKRHAEEVNFLRKTNTQLKIQLDGILAPRK